MEELDSDDRKLSYYGQVAERDIVQFVPMRDFQGRYGGANSLQKAHLAKEVLAEVPDQVLLYMKKIKAVPQTPPPASADTAPQPTGERFDPNVHPATAPPVIENPPPGAPAAGAPPPGGAPGYSGAPPPPGASGYPAAQGYGPPPPAYPGYGPQGGPQAYGTPQAYGQQQGAYAGYQAPGGGYSNPPPGNPNYAGYPAGAAPPYNMYQQR